MDETKRKSYLDLLRIVACFLVIFNHLPGYHLSLGWYGKKLAIYIPISVFTKINVPVFFMISGTLLLGREESISYILKHRVSRIAGALVLTNLIIYPMTHPNGGSFVDLIQVILAGWEEISHWYLYAYMGMLLMLPFLRRIAQSLTRKDFAYLLAMHFALCSLYPMLSGFSYWTTGNRFELSSHFSLPVITSSAFFFPLAGYYLDHNLCVEKLSTKKIAGLAATALCGVVLSSVYSFTQGMLEGELTQNYTGLFDFVIAIAVFIIVKYMFVKDPQRISSKTRKRLAWAGSLTFGIYLLDPILRRGFYESFASILEPYLSVLLLSFVWCMISMVVGGFITFIAKKVPLLREIV